jgi:surface antigen
VIVRALILAGVLLLLPACAARGITIDQIANDQTLITGSIERAEPVPSIDGDLLLDRMTIENAVTSAIVDELPASGLGWANAGTGSRGMVTAIEETRQSAGLCRSFSATRETYAGVHMFRGRTCLGEAGRWATQEFAPS